MIFYRLPLYKAMIRCRGEQCTIKDQCARYKTLGYDAVGVDYATMATGQHKDDHCLFYLAIKDDPQAPLSV